MKRILLTGGSGFIGQNIIDYYKESSEFEIIAPSSKELNCIDEKEVEDYLSSVYFDIVLNFAVYGDGIDKTKDGTKILEYNLRMYYNFAKCSHLYGKMFYAGSGAEYDKRYSICTVSENDIGKSIPSDQYGLMKYIVGRDIEHSNNIYNLRLFGIFGKYEYWPVKFISNICCKAIKGLPLTVRRNVYFDYLWIEDFLRILDEMMKKERLQYHTYNVVSGNKIDLLSLCNLVKEYSGTNEKIIVCDEGIGNEYTASNERLLSEFPNIKITSIEDSVKKLYQWYVDHSEIIDIYKLLY